MSNITVKVEDAISVVCSKCNKTSQLRGVSWRNILDHLQLDEEDFVEQTSSHIERVCSSCRYREQYNKRELTTEQKQRRSEYNKSRRETINEALKLYREQNKQ